jgi:8-oxo-dGTP pyrophosphatase MutT (NUDIX family)
MTIPPFHEEDPAGVGPKGLRPEGARAARPRDAATLILVRRDGPKPRLLMGRRHAGHDFMPDKWVFPGGRVDRADFTAPYATDLRPEVAGWLLRTAPERRARALALAAVRETFEEAGLLLAQLAPVRPGAGPWRPFLAKGALPDLHALDFVARAVTPPKAHKRFDARFFMADAERLLTRERDADCGELDEIAWVSFDEARELNLPNITRFVVDEVALRLEHPGRPIPFVRRGRGDSWLSYL